MVDNCTHYFFIPAPNGETPIGICKICGLKRKMSNVIEEKYNNWKFTKKVNKISI